jgi:anti-sigma regulatory factor (Ser/Thr protein kinase)
MEDQGVSEHQIDVIAGPEAAAVARTAVAGAGVRQLETRIDDVQLAISEVVTNAVRHGRLREGVDAVRVIVGVDGNSVRVTVEQPTTAAGVQIKEPRLEQDDPGGLGMRIVDRVSDDWGHDAGPPGRVWFEFHLDRSRSGT